MKTVRLTKYSDPGHGWLRVPNRLIQKAMMTGWMPSVCSYGGKRYAYLEEDCDAPSFIKSLNGQYTFNIEHKHTNKQSHIRNKPYEVRRFL